MSTEEETKDPPAAEEEEAPKEEESTATFEPVVKLEEVETVTGEEEEECVKNYRAKLYVFGETLLDKGSGTKTWKERGIGDMRLLRHKENGRIRLLMRQEKTMKIIVNHQLDPRIVLTPNVGSDRSWLWNAHDFSDGENLELTSFAIKFKETEIANEYKETFNKLKTEMEAILSGADATTGGAAADEAAAALGALKTSADDDDSDDDV